MEVQAEIVVYDDDGEEIYKTHATLPATPNILDHIVVAGKDNEYEIQLLVEDVGLGEHPNIVCSCKLMDGDIENWRRDGQEK